MKLKPGDSWNGWAPAFVIFLFGGTIATVVYAFTAFETRDHAKEHSDGDAKFEADETAKVTAVMNAQGEIIGRLIHLEDKIDYIGGLPRDWKRKGN